MLEPLRQLMTPGTVAVALGAVGIIALIHWLARDRTPPIILPTARFIPRNDHSAITRRWRDALVFAWRSAFALLTIAAIALWLLPPPRTPGDHEPSVDDPRAPLVIVLDGSGSMREPLGAGTRFDAARAAAAEAINEAAARRQPIVLIGAQRQHRAIPPLLGTEAPALLAALDALRPNDAHTDIARAIASAADRLDELRIERGDLLLLTDGQRASADGLAELETDLRERWRSIEARSFAEPRTEPRLWWIAEDPAEAPAFAQRITLGIDNPADEPRTVTLTLRTTLGTDRQRLTLAPNDTRTLTIPITPTEPGPWEAVASLDSALDAPLLIVGHTPPPIGVLLLDDAAERYAGALDPRDPDEQRDTHWPLRIIPAPITPSPVARHSMPHEQPAIHIARPSTVLGLGSPAAPTPQLLLADSPREIEHIAAQLGITIPTIAQPRTAELATPARAAGLSIGTPIAPHWWARSLGGASVAAADDLGRPLALRTSLHGSPTIVLLGEPDRRDVRLPLLLLELLAPLAPARPSSAITITAGQSATLLIEPLSARQLPLAILGPNGEPRRLTTTPTNAGGPLRLTTPPLDHAGLWRIESADGERIAGIAVTRDPREIDAALVDGATLRAWLRGEEASGEEQASGIRDRASDAEEKAPNSHLPTVLFILALVLLISEPLLGRMLGDAARPITMLTVLRLLAMLMLLVSAWLAWQQHRQPIDTDTPSSAPSADRPTLHILLDRSDSMSHDDASVRPTAARSRLASAEAWVRDAMKAGLETHARPRIVAFPAERTDHTPLLDTLDAALAEALPGDALVILSDGADTTADPLRRTARAERLAQRAAALGVPVHAYPIGGAMDGHHEATLHASITIDPPTMTPGTPAVARIEVHAINPEARRDAEVPTRLRITAAPPALGDPADWPDQLTLLEATLPVPPGGMAFELPITPPLSPPPTPGQRWLAVHLTAEADTNDTARPTRVAEALAIARIDREPRRILVLEGNPAPATRRTVQALARTPGLIVEAGQSLGPRIDFARWQLDPDDPANLQRTTNLSWPPAFAPAPRVAGGSGGAGDADLIILGNRLDRLLTPGEAAALAARIEQGTPVIHLNPPRDREEPSGSATLAILAEALDAAPPEPLFVDDRLGVGDDRWIGAFVRRAIDSGDAEAPIQLLTPARPIRPGASPTIGVLLANPDARAPTLVLTNETTPDRPLPLTRSPGTPGLWLARLPAEASLPTPNTPVTRPLRLTAATDSHAAEAWLSVDGRSPEGSRGLRATDHELLRVIAEGSGGVLSLEPAAAVELLAVFLEQLESDRSMNESGWAGFPAPQGLGWLIAALAGLAGGLIALWTARRWRGLT